VCVSCVRLQTYDPSVCVILAGAIRTLLRMPCDTNSDGRPSPQRDRESKTDRQREQDSKTERDIQRQRQAGLCWVAAQERNPATWAAFCREFERVERTADGTPVPIRASRDLQDGADTTLWLDEIEAVPIVSAPARQAEAQTGAAIDSRKATEGNLRIVRIGTWASLFGQPAAEQQS
jgi:hypothetical protein